MPRTPIPVTQVTRDGVVPSAAAIAASSINDHTFANNGRVFLLLTNSGVVARTATFISQNDDQDDVVITCPAGNAEVQLITLTAFDGTDSFKLTYNGTETIAFVRGTNATQAALQAALRTATGDTGLIVTGSADAGPFTATFSTEFDAYPITVTSGSGCSGVVTESTKGSTGQRLCGPFPRSLFNTAAGLVNMDPDAATSFTVAAFRY